MMQRNSENVTTKLADEIIMELNLRLNNYNKKSSFKNTASDIFEMERMISRTFEKSGLNELIYAYEGIYKIISDLKNHHITLNYMLNNNKNKFTRKSKIHLHKLSAKTEEVREHFLRLLKRSTIITHEKYGNLELNFARILVYCDKNTGIMRRTNVKKDLEFIGKIIIELEEFINII